MPPDNPDSPENSPVDPEWWKYIFDEIYLLTDARSICNKEITRAEADLMEQPLKQFAMDGDVLRLNFTPFEIKSLRLEPSME